MCGVGEVVAHDALPAGGELQARVRDGRVATDRRVRRRRLRERRGTGGGGRYQRGPCGDDGERAHGPQRSGPPAAPSRVRCLPRARGTSSCLRAHAWRPPRYSRGVVRRDLRRGHHAVVQRELVEQRRRAAGAAERQRERRVLRSPATRRRPAPCRTRRRRCRSARCRARSSSPTMWWYAPSAGTPTVECASVVTPALRSQTWLPEPAFMTVSCSPLRALVEQLDDLRRRRALDPALDREAVADVEAVRASGTRAVSLTPSNDAAVSPAMTPGWPSVTPLRYVPLLALPEESVMTVLGARVAHPPLADGAWSRRTSTRRWSPTRRAASPCRRSRCPMPSTVQVPLGFSPVERRQRVAPGVHVPVNGACAISGTLDRRGPRRVVVEHHLTEVVAAVAGPTSAVDDRDRASRRATSA